MIEELVFENFRGFRSLDLKGLEPVNLIVGHNNTGKTSLLEGILLSCQPNRGVELPGMFRAVQGRDDLRYFPWLIRDGAHKEEAILKRKGKGVESSLLLTKDGPSTASRDSGYPELIGPLAKFFLFTSPGREALICRVVSVQHRDPNSLVSLIGKAYRKRNGEETFQKLMATIDPRIKKVRIDPGEDGNQVVVDIGLRELLPLAQVGQGVYRLATIVADIIGEQTSVLLIDEIENGLHHSIQKQVWVGLAAVAKELNVQIFATTHSGECLNAAHKAFLGRQPEKAGDRSLIGQYVHSLGDSQSYDLAVIQLFRTDDGVQGRVLDKEHIETFVSPGLLDSKSAIAFIFDADTQPEQTRISLEALLSRVTGQQVADGRWSAGTPRIGLFIVPGGNQPGEIETLVWNSAASDEANAKEKECVQRYIACMQMAGATAHSEAKGLLGALLAVKYDEDPRLGPGARNNRFNLARAELQTLRGFLSGFQSSPAD